MLSQYPSKIWGFLARGSGGGGGGQVGGAHAETVQRTPVTSPHLGPCFARFDWPASRSAAELDRLGKAVKATASPELSIAKISCIEGEIHPNRPTRYVDG